MVTDRRTEFGRIIESFNVFDVPGELQVLVVEALKSDKWDWYEDCDGCTCVSEVYWPTKYFPPCVRHDFDCFIGQGGWNASKLFYRLQRVYGMGRVRSWIRAAAVTVAWYFPFRKRKSRIYCAHVGP